MFIKPDLLTLKSVIMKKIYLMKSLFTLAIFVALASQGFGQFNLLYVGGEATLGETKTSDVDIVDSLTSWGWNVTYLGQSDYQAAADPYNGIDGVVFSESVGSTSVTRFGPNPDASAETSIHQDNFPLNFITMEVGALSSSSSRWDLFAATGGICASASASGDDLVMVVDNNQHYITSEYNIGDEITWSTSSGFLVGYLWDFKYSYTGLTKPKATGPWANDVVPASQPYVISYLDDFNWAVQACIFSVTHDLLENHQATQEFYDLMKRAAQFTFIGDPTKVDDVAYARVNEMHVFPNPASYQVRVQFRTERSVNTEISMIDITGKELARLYSGLSNPGNNTFFLNATDYTPGVYLLQMRTPAGASFTKLVIR
jgi:hypothetical protein